MKFSVIIPTYGRPPAVIERTINSVLNLNLEQDLIGQIFLIDQNNPTLTLTGPYFSEKYFKVHYESDSLKSSTAKVIHIYGLSPSVTRAKNCALKLVKDDLILFLDDDIEIHAGSVKNAHEFLTKNPGVPFVAGRESILPPDLKINKKRKFLKNIAAKILPKNKEYQHDGHYIGYLKNNSFFFCDYSINTKTPVQVNVARGCVWATRYSYVTSLGGFDEHFQGTALREESDLQLRLFQKYGSAYYLPDLHVNHYRQLGGCNNLSKNYSTLISKFQNEAYFQKKHFPNISRFWFFMRLCPVAFEFLFNTWGASLLMLFQFTITLNRAETK